MTADAPTWGPWTTYYNTVGQGLDMSTLVENDGVSVSFLFSGFTLEVGNGAPLAGAVGLAGELSVSIPEEFELLGIRLEVDCTLDNKTSGAAALFTCSIGTGTYAREWPLGDMLDSGSPRSPRIGRRQTDGNGEVKGDFDASFTAICFMGEANPVSSGDPRAQPPLAPFPITLGMQARCQTADDVVRMGVTKISVALARSS